MIRLLLSWTLWGRYYVFFGADVFSGLAFLLLVSLDAYVYAFIQSRFYLGDIGNGAAMKLVVNMIMGRCCKISIYLFLFSILVLMTILIVHFNTCHQFLV